MTPENLDFTFPKGKRSQLVDEKVSLLDYWSIGLSLVRYGFEVRCPSWRLTEITGIIVTNHKSVLSSSARGLPAQTATNRPRLSVLSSLHQCRLKSFCKQSRNRICSRLRWRLTSNRIPSVTASSVHRCLWFERGVRSISFSTCRPSR